ncbi:hypothetical protein [Gelidibacter sp.]|uniref:hypothetical protein n=1 Tax=Gelidibacter sp. TaxID=2018083 RepID=UPI002BB21D87|nr:hypothetical protein [Gelidibacter sp.]HUH26659.1 hypothetical protein [Gelidibacter sp.]
MKPITHTYKEVNVGKYKEVKHFELVSCNGQQALTNLINISKDRQFAKISPVYWLKNHNGKKWTTAITGLFRVPHQNNVFFGDLRRKQDLLIVRIKENPLGNEMTFYVYPNYYPFNKNLLPTQTGNEISNMMNKKSTSRV